MQKTKTSSEPKAGGKAPTGSPGRGQTGSRIINLRSDPPTKGCSSLSCPIGLVLDISRVPQRTYQGGVSVKPEGTGITGLLLIQLHSVN